MELEAVDSVVDNQLSDALESDIDEIEDWQEKNGVKESYYEHPVQGLKVFFSESILAVQMSNWPLLFVLGVLGPMQFCL